MIVVAGRRYRFTVDIEEQLRQMFAQIVTVTLRENREQLGSPGQAMAIVRILRSVMPSFTAIQLKAASSDL